MPRPLRVAIVNEVWAPEAATDEALLDRFPTLTGWADAVAAHGATVAVFQRFQHDASLVRSAVEYRFIADAGPPRPGALYVGSPALRTAVDAWAADVVHVNGFDHPRSLRRFRSARLIVQDHGGFDPRQVRVLRRWWMRSGLRAARACLVATPPQIDLFRTTGIVPPQVRLYDVLEGSTTLRAAARRQSRGRPALLWVGRLNDNKDPLTVLDGFARFAAQQPGATLTYVYQDGDLEPQLRAAIQGNHRLCEAVVLRGAVAHARLADEYAAADFFVLGSHHESTGYAVLEALACGAVPVVTDIPSYRWMTDSGSIGALWTPGDARSLCAALQRAIAQPIESQRAACRRRFDAHLSWDAIGRRALAIYEEVSRS